MTDADKHPVLFVGAGPGDPELITVAGRRALETADLVVYAGSLVSREMLSWCRSETAKIDSAKLNLDEIVKAMAQAWEKGQRVVRLHTGDPSLYGAVAEQFRALEKRGIPYQVIPGVTAAFAAAAALGLEFTLPEVSQSLILTRAPGRTPVPKGEDLTKLAASGASLAVYLSASQTQKVRQALSQARGADAPVAVVYRASWPDERVLWTTAGDLTCDMEAAGIKRQALILAGPAVEAQGRGEAAAGSRLYDPGFSHGWREAKPGKKDAS